MIIDKEDLKLIEEYLDLENVKNLINSLKIHEVLKDAYQELGTNDLYLFLYGALLKAGFAEEFDVPNYGLKVEKFGGVQLKVTIDFDRIKQMFELYEGYSSRNRDDIDIVTCLALIEDPYEVIKNWNYDDPSAYSDIQDSIAKGYVSVNADNEHNLSLYSEEDQTRYLMQAAGDAAMNCVEADVYNKACEALTEALKSISDSTTIHENSVEIVISYKTLIDCINESEDWKDELDYAQVDGSLIPCVIGYCLSLNYEFYEPYAGFDTSFNDEQFNETLASILELAE